MRKSFLYKVKETTELACRLELNDNAPPGNACNNFDINQIDPMECLKGRKQRCFKRVCDYNKISTLRKCAKDNTRSLENCIVDHEFSGNFATYCNVLAQYYFVAGTQTLVTADDVSKCISQFIAKFTEPATVNGVETLVLYESALQNEGVGPIRPREIGGKGWSALQLAETVEGNMASAQKLAPTTIDPLRALLKDTADSVLDRCNLNDISFHWGNSAQPTDSNGRFHKNGIMEIGNCLDVLVAEAGISFAEESA